jgi:Cu-Zn family superoxide dismutase
MKMRWIVVVGMLVVAGGIAAAKGKAADKAKGQGQGKTAMAKLEAKSGSTVDGKASFSEKGKEVTLVVEVANASPGEHAVHIHETGDCSSPDGKSAGGHWNPMTDQHGKWEMEHHHLGDIGNMNVGADGKGTIKLTTDKWALGSGAPNDPVGKSIVVHGGVDDFKTQPTGNAGNRIACGVITAEAAAK